ncbi:MAG: hypothetical protein ACJ8C4_12325 [Gemmataceae bacterium]
MDATQLPGAVDGWLSMLDRVGKSIVQAIAETEDRESRLSEAMPQLDTERAIAHVVNRIDHRLTKLAQRLDQAGSTAAQAGAELAAVEDTLRNWVDGVRVVSGRLTLPPEV